MRVFQIDPIADTRWERFLERHPRASVFHTPAWLNALRATYGYRPTVFTTSSFGCELTNGVLLCRVDSCLTGRRLVSVPFSDHCEPLVDDREQLQCIINNLREEWKGCGWKYIELRALDADMSGFAELDESQIFCLHRLDLQASLEDLFQGFHASCIRRKILRAEREGLSYEEGRTEALVEKFYRLFVLTRRKQMLLPSSIGWFRNLVLSGIATIHLAANHGEPVAGILTLRYKNTLVYKYGCSDQRNQSLGGTQLLFWKAIQRAKHLGLTELDMGRSDWPNQGLISFKDRWGAVRSTLIYRRFGKRRTSITSLGLQTPMVRHVIGRLPNTVLTSAGTLLYPHAA